MPGLPLAFTFPFVLAALAGLPLLYFLLRITPPRPALVPFPPLRLILGLRPRNETASRTPWWLLLLRLAIAALLIFAMAGPVLNPLPAATAREGSLLIVLDDGWPAAPGWERKIAAAARGIEAAERNSQLAAVVATSEAGRDIVPLDAAKAQDRLRALKPVPFVPDRLPVFSAIEKYATAQQTKPAIVWIADGLDRGHAREFAGKLAAVSGELTVVTDSTTVRALAGVQNQTGRLDVRVLRAPSSGPQVAGSNFAGPERGVVRALDRKGLQLGEALFDFGAANETQASFEMPVELRNEIVRLEIAREHSAAAVFLLDERWRRRRIGLVSGETADIAQPLLAPSYYLTKALSPFADIREARPATTDPARSLLDDHVAIMILADAGMVPGQAHDGLVRFVEDGGILVRFAGPHLAAASGDLVPVRLRRGGRVLGGAMSWDTPKKLAPFDRESPFFGLAVPDEVTVSRQVLAEPDPGLSAKTWARLSDGTPLVTAARQGKGLIVLFHVTADTTWSNLPISGLFVEMLRKIVALSAETAKDADAQAGAGTKVLEAATFAPSRSLDGFGVLGPPPPNATPISAGFEGIAEPEHPPGFYGPPDGLIAVNALGPKDTLRPADYSGFGFIDEPLAENSPVDLKPWLLATAFLLFAADTLASLWLSGSLRARGARLSLPCSLCRWLRDAGPGAGRGRVRTRKRVPARYWRRADDEACLCGKRGCQGRRGEQAGLDEPFAGACAAHVVDARRSCRHRSRAGRIKLLSASVLAYRGVGTAAAARGGRQGRPLHETGGHDYFRYPRRARFATRRPADAGSEMAQSLARWRRCAGTRTRSRRPCRDKNLLSHRRFRWPLHDGRDLDRGAAPRPRRWRPAPGPRGRQRLADHHHRQRSSGGLGQRSRR